jgi:hypothetical protein
MKTENKKGKLGLLLLVTLAGSFVVAYTHIKNNEKAKMAGDADQTFSLVKPVFAQSSSPTFLEDEAGMSIWVNIGASLNISQAKAAYKTIEKETPDYIIGSISLPNLPETEDPHCFVHKDGWIVVYYLKAEPVGKIIDWSYYTGSELTKTKLSLGLEKIGLTLGITTIDAQYYHFQYPYANKWMVIIDVQEGQGEDSFRLMVPSEFSVYERSWVHNFVLNTRYGTLNESQLSSDVYHTIVARVAYDNLHYYWGSFLIIDGNQISGYWAVSGATSSRVAIILVYAEP